MARHIPTVRAGVLIVEPPTGGARLEVPPESDAWFRWLESARTFAFEDTSGHFTARKKRRWGADYWYAFRRGSGRLYETYLGRARDITLGRLRAVAVKLNQSAAIPKTPSMRAQAPLVPARLTTAGRHAPDASGASSAAATHATPIIHTAAVERLTKAADYALTVVSAPAGYGKTTLLAQAHDVLGSPWATLTLDERDNDLMRFWTRAAAALQHAAPGLKAAWPVSIDGNGHRSMDVALATLLSALAQSRSPIFLLLDDYHALWPDNTALHESVAHFVMRLPPQAHLVLASRTPPPLPLATLRARQRLLELGMADLRLTLAETRLFLDQQVDPRLTDDEVATLHARTEGWVAALRLAALSAREHADPHGWIEEFDGESGSIFDYLVEEIISRMPAQLYAFALQIAPLHQVSGPLCDAVTHSTTGHTMLDEMERANFFLTPLDARREWFHLHTLVANALRRRLRQTRPRLESHIYARASDWCESHALPRDAMDYAIAANEAEAEHAAQLVEECIPSTLAHGSVALLRDSLERLPDKVIREHPRLSVTHAYTLYLTGERIEMQRRLRDAEQAIARWERLVDPAALGVVQAEALALRAAFGTLTGEGSPRAQIASLQQASAALPRAHEFQNIIAFYLGVNQALDGNVRAASQTLDSLMRASLIQGNEFYIGNTMLYLGLSMLLQGRLDAALALCARVDRHLTEDGASMPDALQARMRLIRGKVLFERGELEPAVDHLRRATELGYDPGVILIEAYSTLAHAQLALGRADSAELTMEQCIALCEEAPAERKALWVWTGRQARAHQAHLRLIQGDVESAAAWAHDLKRFQSTSSAHRASTPAYVQELEDIVLARLSLSERRPADALTGLKTLGVAAEADGRIARLLEILTLQAVAHHALDDTPAALETLRRAVEVGWRQRFVRAFIEGGPTIERLLPLLRVEHASQAPSQDGHSASVRWRREDALQAYIGRLSNAFSPATHHRRRRSARPPTRAGVGEHAPTVPAPKLTPREYEVLRLIADGASNDDIARELVIAPSTAKRHVSNIFAALDVRRRTQAVARARASGILTPDAPDEEPADSDT